MIQCTCISFYISIYLGDDVVCNYHFYSNWLISIHGDIKHLESRHWCISEIMQLMRPCGMPFLRTTLCQGLSVL